MFCLQFSFFPFQYMEVFHQLELDLLAYSTPPRPTTFAMQVYEKLHRSHPGLREEAEKMVNTVMKPPVQKLTKERTMQNRKIKNNPSLLPINERWFGELWPLNPVTCVDWREEKRTQNAGRDWVKYAAFTILEMETTETYRQKLLDTSTAAAFLRETFQKAMQPFCQKRVFETFEEPREVIALTGWYYPDSYDYTKSPSRPKVKLDDVVTSRESRRLESAERRSLLGLMTKIQSMSIFKATLTTGVLDDEARRLMNQLEAVSR